MGRVVSARKLYALVSGVDGTLRMVKRRKTGGIDSGREGYRAE